MENDFGVKKINAKEELKFHKKEIRIGNSMIYSFIIHCSHHLSSHWLKAYS